MKEPHPIHKQIGLGESIVERLELHRKATWVCRSIEYRAVCCGHDASIGWIAS
jgi:hypothetical protein